MSEKHETLLDDVQRYFATVDDETLLRDLKEAGFHVVAKPRSFAEHIKSVLGNMTRKKS